MAGVEAVIDVRVASDERGSAAQAWSAAAMELGARPASAEAVERLWPGSRLLLAERDGVATGLCVLSPMAGRFRLRPPDLADGQRAEQLAVAHALCSAARAIAPADAVIEAFPADDVRHDVVWRQGMAAAGFAEVAATRVWERASGAVAPPTGLGVVLRPVAALEPAPLHALVHAVRNVTRDRVDTGRPEQPADVLARLATDPVASPVPDLWLAACDEVTGEPVGYVLGSVDRERAVWVVDVGVHPGQRGQGLGRVLVDVLLTRAAAAGYERVRAQIDRVNEPSEALHRAAGFTLTPGTYRTWHATGPGSAP